MPCPRVSELDGSTSGCVHSNREQGLKLYDYLIDDVAYLIDSDWPYSLEHRAKDGFPHSQRSGERDPPAMNMEEESSVGCDRCLTLTEVKAWSFGKQEGLTRV